MGEGIYYLNAQDVENVYTFFVGIVNLGLFQLVALLVLLGLVCVLIVLSSARRF